MALRMPAILTIEGRALSFFNQCLVVSQSERPVTIVGGFKQWKTAGRMVRKGEHGLGIWVPTFHKSEDGQTVDDDPNFIIWYVFDVSQTEEISSTTAAA